MDPELERRSLNLLSELLDVSQEDRPLVLESRTPGDEPLRQRVLALLEFQNRELGEALTERSPWKGRVLGRYRLEEVLGTGGMGTVFRANDELLSREVAIKVFRGGWTLDDREKERILAEARAASRIDHPHICPVHDLGEGDDGTPYLVMGLCEGRTLRELIREGPPPSSTPSRWRSRWRKALPRPTPEGSCTGT